MASVLDKFHNLVADNRLATLQFGAGVLGAPNLGQGLQQGLLGAMQAKQWSDQREEKKKQQERFKELINMGGNVGPMKDLGGGVQSQDLGAPIQPGQANQYGVTPGMAKFAEVLGPEAGAQFLARASIPQKINPTDARKRYEELISMGVDPKKAMMEAYNFSDPSSRKLSINADIVGPIIQKYQRNLAEDPNYQLPAEDQKVLDMALRANPLDVLLRQALGPATSMQPTGTRDNPARPRNKEEAQQLESGTWFVDPSGNLIQKK